MRGSNGKSGLGSRPTSAAARTRRRAPRNGRTRRSVHTNSANRLNRASRGRGEPEPAARAAGTSRESASRAMVQPGIRLPARPMYPLGPCSTGSRRGVEAEDQGESRPVRNGRRCRCRRSRACPGRARRAARHRPTAEPPAGRARSEGPGRRVRPGARAGRDRRAGPRPRPASPAPSRRSSSAVSASWLAVLSARSTRGSPAGRSDCEAPAGSARSRHRARRQSL